MQLPKWTVCLSDHQTRASFADPAAAGCIGCCLPASHPQSGTFLGVGYPDRLQSEDLGVCGKDTENEDKSYTMLLLRGTFNRWCEYITKPAISFGIRIKINEKPLHLNILHYQKGEPDTCSVVTRMPKSPLTE